MIDLREKNKTHIFKFKNKEDSLKLLKILEKANIKWMTKHSATTLNPITQLNARYILVKNVDGISKIFFSQNKSMEYEDNATLFTGEEQIKY